MQAVVAAQVMLLGQIARAADGDLVDRQVVQRVPVPFESFFQPREREVVHLSEPLFARKGGAGFRIGDQMGGDEFGAFDARWPGGAFRFAPFGNVHAGNAFQRFQ